MKGEGIKDIPDEHTWLFLEKSIQLNQRDDVLFSTNTVSILYHTLECSYAPSMDLDVEGQKVFQKERVSSELMSCPG